MTEESARACGKTISANLSLNLITAGRPKIHDSISPNAKRASSWAAATMVQWADRMQAESPEKWHAKYLDPRTGGGAMDCHLGVQVTDVAWGCTIPGQDPRKYSSKQKQLAAERILRWWSLSWQTVATNATWTLHLINSSCPNQIEASIELVLVIETIESRRAEH